MCRCLRLCFLAVATHIVVSYNVDGDPNKVTDIDCKARRKEDFLENQLFQNKISDSSRYDVRRKRTASHVMLITSAILRGIEAVKALLKGAKPITTEGKVKQYAKHGNYDQAVNDFYAVRPHDVSRFRLFQGIQYGGVGMRGRVGDRTLIIKSKGTTGKPTMEIMKTDISTGYVKIRKTDILIYTD